MHNLQHDSCVRTLEFYFRKIEPNFNWTVQLNQTIVDSILKANRSQKVFLAKKVNNFLQYVSFQRQTFCVWIHNSESTPRLKFYFHEGLDNQGLAFQGKCTMVPNHLLDSTRGDTLLVQCSLHTYCAILGFKMLWRKVHSLRPIDSSMDPMQHRHMSHVTFVVDTTHHFLYIWLHVSKVLGNA